MDGRVEEAAPLLDPDIDWLEPEEQPDRRVVKGADAALTALAEWLEAWSGYEIEIHEMVDAPGNRVFVSLTHRAAGATSGLQFESELYQVWTFGQERPVRMEMFFDAEKARAAAHSG